VLLCKVKRDKAGRQYSQPRGVAAECLDEARACFRQVFAIIQHQEHGSVAQVIQNRAGGRVTGVGGQTQRRRDRVVHSISINNACQFDEADVMGKNACHAVSDLDRQACLPTPPGPVNVTSLTVRRDRRSTRRADSCWRPKKRVRTGGRRIGSNATRTVRGRGSVRRASRFQPSAPGQVRLPAPGDMFHRHRVRRCADPPAQSTPINWR